MNSEEIDERGAGHSAVPEKIIFFSLAGRDSKEHCPAPELFSRLQQLRDRGGDIIMVQSSQRWSD